MKRFINTCCTTSGKVHSMSPSRQIRPFFDQATSTFSYLVDDGCGHAAVIDPVMGFDLSSGRLDAAPAEPIAQAIRQEGLSLQWLLETHAHADHISAALYLRNLFGGATAIGEDITRVQKIFRGVYNSAGARVDGSQFDRLLKDGDRITIGRVQVEVLHVPGHTPADVAYRVFEDGCVGSDVFVGDTLFMPDRGTARCDFPGGCASTLFHSVRRLLDLPEDTQIYVCHDYPAPLETARYAATVRDHRQFNIHVRDGVSPEKFVAQRTARDMTLAVPVLMLPAVQVNLCAGSLPQPEDNGVSYLKIPLNQF